jgi:hypothetical protein
MWEAIGSVSSGLSLAAFLAAAIVTLLRRRLVHKEKLITSAPENERALLVQSALDSYSINTRDLTKQQRYELLLEQIKQRERRFKITASVIVILAVLFTALAAYAIGFKRSAGPLTRRYSFDFDNQSLVWATNYLDKKATDIDIHLDDKIISGEVTTKLFSVHINNAELEEIIEIFCLKSSSEMPLVWIKKGKQIIISPKK